MSEKKPDPAGPAKAKPAPCARGKTEEDAQDPKAKKKSLFRIVPVDPKNTLNFEDTADK